MKTITTNDIIKKGRYMIYVNIVDYIKSTVKVQICNVEYSA